MIARSFVVASMLCVSWVGLAHAECDPSKFTFEEIEKYKFSDVLTLNAWDIMEESAQSKAGKGFDLGAVIYGAPVNVNYKEAKEAASYMKKNSGIAYARDQQLDFFRSNLSIIGASMYKDCLARLTEEFKVAVPDIAYTENEFLLDVVWTPTASLADRKPTATVKLRVLNGTADGASVAEQTVDDKKSATFLISRTDPTKSLQIVPTVDGIPYGSEAKSIVIPAVIDLKFEAVLRSWPGPEGGFSPLCSDDGGGNCGSDAHNNKACIHSQGGLFLPSTFTYEISGINYREPIVEARSDSVCVTYSTRPREGADGFGQKGYSSIDKFNFSIRELVPKT